MKRYALIFALGISSQALAADITIEMLNKDADGNKMVYSEEIVRIGIGDTVTWVPTDKGHNVEMVSSPNDMKFKSKNNKVAQSVLMSLLKEAQSFAKSN